jgi:hypothetical protein
VTQVGLLPSGVPFAAGGSRGAASGGDAVGCEV